MSGILSQDEIAGLSTPDIVAAAIQ